MANRLATATSPYLLQHADNPVDWWEWEPAAFEEARRRNVPVLLSVGYAACHWCHVMAHESFEDEATAAYLNEHFVSIKVDREERPDVDAVYMDATTSMTGHGGWPMTCVLDHDGNPFFAGTYFPDQPRHGQPSFRQVLEALTDAWQTRPEDVQRVAGKLREHLGRATAMAAGAITEETLARAVQLLRQEYDGASGGFGVPEVPAVDGAGVPAPPRCAADDAAHPRVDGSRRHLRPARRRLRALLRRRVLGGAALREDALRQRPAARPLRAGRRSALRPDRPGDRRLHAPRAGHGRGRVRLRAGCRQRGGRGQVLRLVPRSSSRCWGRTTAPGRRRSSRSPRPAPSSTAPPPCSCWWSRKDLRGFASPTYDAGCSRPAPRGSGRPSTTRWSPPGTGSPSPASATPDCASASRRTSMRRWLPASSSGGCTSSTAGCAGSPGTASWAHRPGCSRTTAAWLPASSHSCRRLETRSGSTARGCCSTPRSSGSAPTTAASSTPRPTPRHSWPGRETPATTRRRRGSRR